MITKLLTAYIDAERTAKAASGRVTDDAMDFLVDAVAEAEAAFLAAAPSASEAVEYARQWLAFNRGSAVPSRVWMMLEAPASLEVAA